MSMVESVININEDEEYDDDEIIDILSNHTTVIRYDGGVVINTEF